MHIFLLRDRCGRLGIARVGVCCVWGSGAGGHRRRGWARPRSAAPEVTARVSKPQTMPIPSLLRRHFPHRAIQTGVMTRTRCFHPVFFFMVVGWVLLFWLFRFFIFLVKILPANGGMRSEMGTPSSCHPACALEIIQIQSPIGQIPAQIYLKENGLDLSTH